MTIDDINRILKEIDKIQRPVVICLNPKTAKLLEPVFPQIEDRAIIQQTPFLEDGKIIMMKRKDLEVI